MLLLMRHTALAISDVATLARARIRDGEILVFWQKTGNLVRLPLPPDLEMVLDALPPPRGMESEATHYSWNPATMTRRCVVGVAERTLAAVFKKSGVAHARADRFRHTLATEILSRGGSDQDAADVLATARRLFGSTMRSGMSSVRTGLRTRRWGIGSVDPEPPGSRG